MKGMYAVLYGELGVGLKMGRKGKGANINHMIHVISVCCVVKS